MLSTRTYRFTGQGLGFVLILLFLGVVTRAEASNCCQPPPDLDYACDKLPYGFDPYDLDQLQSLFGEPVEKCSGFWYEELTPVVHLNNCNIGTITRKFQLVNGYGRKYTCSQEVTLKGVHDYLIYFPEDASAYCEAPDPEPLIKRENACDLLAVSKKDQVFGTSSTGCYKILRTYKVINWCEYDGESPFVKIGRDEDCDGIPGDEGVWVVRRKTGTVFLDRDDDIYNLTPTAAENACTGKAGYWKNSQQESRLQSTGAWQYTQHIKVYDDVQPEITAAAVEPFCSVANDCMAPVEIPFGIQETCSADDLTIKVFFFANGVPVPLTEQNNIAPGALSGSFPDFRISGRFPLGDHLFEVHVQDGCGNSGLEKIPFTVVDCKAPVPVCYHGISMSLMPVEPGTDADGDGDADEFANVVWVSDLLRSETFDCNGPIKYSINRVGESPDPWQDNLVLTCADADTVRVEVYAWDSAFNPYAVQPNGVIGGPNYDHCETYIAIKEGICPDPPPPARIAGKVKTFTGMAVDQVEIWVTGGMDMMQMTNNEGAYLLNVMPDRKYVLKPHKEGDLMNAVNTEDIIELTHHLTGRRKLTNPYQLIAADVNNSGSITILDLVYLRKAVLGEIDAFPNNESWRFISASYAFPDPLNPWSAPFPEYENVDNMTMATRWANFYAVKVGDVDNSISGENGRTLAEPALLTMEDRYLESGKFYELPVVLPAASAGLAGLQFELALDVSALRMEAVGTGLLSAAFLGQAKLETEGLLAVSWNSLNEYQPLTEGTLFTLRLQARRSGYLSAMLRLTPRRLAAEGYDTDGEVRPLQLNFIAADGNLSLQLDQNYPNPFREETRVRFYSPFDGPVRFQVFDLNGRLLHTQTGNFAAGEQTIFLQAADLDQTGVLLYTLEAAGQRLTRKMVVLGR